MIHGHADDGFGSPADALAANFARHGETGAARAVSLDRAEHLVLALRECLA
jgi:hypothetical protein